MYRHRGTTMVVRTGEDVGGWEETLEALGSWDMVRERWKNGNEWMR